MSDTTIKLGNRRLTAYFFRGEVAAVQQTVLTHLHASGGAYNAPISASSSNTVVKEVFIRNAENDEITINLVDSSLGVREGHKVTVVNGVFAHKGNGPNLLFRNHSLRKSQRLANLTSVANPPQGFKELGLLTLTDWTILFLLVGGLVMLAFHALAPLAIIAGAILGLSARRRRRGQLEKWVAEIDAALERKYG